MIVNIPDNIFFEIKNYYLNENNLNFEEIKKYQELQSKTFNWSMLEV